MVKEVNDLMVASTFVVVKESDIIKASSDSEASEIVQVLSDQYPGSQYRVLEVHPDRPKGMGRDPDLH